MRRLLLFDLAFMTRQRAMVRSLIRRASPAGPVLPDRRKRFRLSRRSSRLLVIMSLLLSIMLFNYAERFETLRAQSEFETLTTRSVQDLRRKLHSYAQTLNAAAAFATTGREPSSEEFSAYIARLDLPRTAPGIVDVDLVRSTAPDAPIFKTLQMARAREQTTLSPQFSLPAQARARNGFVMAKALGGLQDIPSPEGWVVVWVSADGLFSNMTAAQPPRYTLRIHDDVAQSTLQTTVEPFGQGDFASVYTTHFYGQTWQISFSSTPAFDAEHTSFLPHILLLFGMALALGLALSLRVTAHHHRSLKFTAALRERQLDARGEENRALLESSVSVVMMLDKHACITYANEAAAKLFRCRRTDFESRLFSEFVRLEPAQEADLSFNAIGQRTCGEFLKLDVQSNKWNTADGEEKTTVLIRDVTDQINKRIEIEAVHQRYDIALTGSGIGIFDINLNTGETVMSDTWHKIAGTDRIAGSFDHKRDFLARIHPDDLPLLLEADQRCIAGETQRSVAEYRLRFKEGWRWMYSDAVPWDLDAEGHATRLLGTQCDVTELRHARNALELSEARFRVVLEDAPVGMAVIDESGRFLGVNTALTRLCGYSAKMLEEDMRLSQLLSRQCYVDMSRDVRALLRSGSSETYQAQVELRTRSEEQCWGLFNLSWTYDKNRGQYVYIAQIIDITDQKRVEQIKSEFIATVSHELRTPLTSIKGALALLAATTAAALPVSAKRLLEIAQVNSDRLTVIVNNILDLERISSGEVVFELAPTPLGPLVLDVFAQIEAEASPNGNVLVFEGPSDEVMIHIDVARMRQVLTNLLSNACKFSDPQTQVVVRTELSLKSIRILVENTGPPIPESFQVKMFETFTQADGSDTRSKGGTGLGLSIAREIMARMEGQIGFEQNAGRKTVFWVTCPLASAATKEDDEIPMPHNALKTGGLQLFHIEDDRDFCDVIAAGFEAVAEISHAHSIGQAQSVMGRAKWDAILLDWNLPDGDAAQLMDSLCDAHPFAPIIALAADDRSPPDPRITATFIKSQVEITRIVEHVISIIHTAHAEKRKAVG